eukprot:SAG11_NODE_1139_length_5714_cov_20.900267_6_plen_187_part_00
MSESSSGESSTLDLSDVSYSSAFDLSDAPSDAPSVKKIKPKIKKQKTKIKKENPQPPPAPGPQPIRTRKETELEQVERLRREIEKENRERALRGGRETINLARSRSEIEAIARRRASRRRKQPPAQLSSGEEVQPTLRQILVIADFITYQIALVLVLQVDTSMSSGIYRYYMILSRIFPVFHNKSY